MCIQLVFCSTKNGTESLASLLSKQIQLPRVLDPLVESIEDKKLRVLVGLGYAFHHAGIHLSCDHIDARYGSNVIKCNFFNIKT